MQVLGLNKERKVVEKELTLSKEHGAILTYNGKSLCIEPNLEIFNKLYKPEQGSDGLTCAFVYVTTDCNKHCSYCYNEKVKWKHHESSSWKDIANMLKDYVNNDTRDCTKLPYRDFKYDQIHPVIRFLGGEPTVSPDLDKLLNWSVDNKGNKIVVYTNGINMQEKSYFKNMPKSDRICWFLSVDWNMSEDFIKRWTENILEYGGGQEYGYSLNMYDDNLQKSIEQDAFIRTYKPEEIRYRGMSEQDGSKFSTASEVLNFICTSRNIDMQTFLDEGAWYQQILTCLNYKDTENPDTGNIVAARLPVWNTMLVDEFCKIASINITTKSFWNPPEGHASSKDMFVYRMNNKDKFYHPSRKSTWNVRNKYIK